MFVLKYEKPMYFNQDFSIIWRVYFNFLNSFCDVPNALFVDELAFVSEMWLKACTVWYLGTSNKKLINLPYDFIPENR